MFFLQGEIDNPKYTTALEIEEGDTVNGIPFPDFAICDPNPFSLEKVRKLICNVCVNKC